MSYGAMWRQARPVGFGVVLALAACSRPDTRSEPMAENEVAGMAKPLERPDEAPGDDGSAVAILEGKSGCILSGEAAFTKADGGVSVELRVQNAPAGEHGVHIHEDGDCSAPDASSAGGHWNPASENHGKRGKIRFTRGTS